MKVDWKYFAQTAGYKSLKKSVNQDKRSWHGTSEKARAEGHFRAIIAMVIKCSQQTGMKPWVILDILEEKRDYWYTNYYRWERFVEEFGAKPKRKLHPATLRGEIKRLKKHFHNRRNCPIGKSSYRGCYQELQRRYSKQSL